MRVRGSRRGGRPPLLLPAQIQNILDGCAVVDAGSGEWTGNLRDRLLFALMAETGMRLGELLGMRINDFVMGRGGTAYVEVVPRCDNPNGARVKMMRPRRVYVGSQVEQLFADYLTHLACRAAEFGIAVTADSPLLVNLQRPPLLAALREGTVRDKTTALRRKGIGPADWTPHWFRHTHATALLLAGIPEWVVSRRLGPCPRADHPGSLRLGPRGRGANVNAVQRMLGHASAQMTLDVYAGLFDTDLDSLADNLNIAYLGVNADSVLTEFEEQQVSDLHAMAEKPNVTRLFPGAASENRTRDLRITRFDQAVLGGLLRCADVLEPRLRVRRRARWCTRVAASVAAAASTLDHAYRPGQRHARGRAEHGSCRYVLPVPGGYAGFRGQPGDNGFVELQHWPVTSR